MVNAAESEEAPEFVEVLPLARGGMGSVSIAVRKRGDFSRLYAVKRLHSTLLLDPQLTASFVDEGRIAGLIRDSHVVSVLDVGTDSRGPFLVMDWIESVPLHRVIRNAHQDLETIPLSFCIEVIRQVAEGLHAAHELCDHAGKSLEVVHRDISPQNILVGYDGIVRVTDFGVARALDRQSETQTGQIKGKLGYLSPEQVRCEHLDQRSDLFSLGIVAYEILTTRRLYAAGPTAILTAPPPDLGELRDDVPDELVELLIDLLSKKPEHRPDSALTVVHRLESMISELSHEEGLTVRTYMSANFEEDRVRLRTRLSAALDALSEEEEAQDKVAAEEKARPRRRLAIGAAMAVALTGALIVGWSAMSSSASDETPTLSTQATDPVIEPPATEAPSALVVLPASANAPEAMEANPVAEPESAARRARREARRRRRSEMRAREAQSPAMSPPTMSASGMGVTPWPYQ